LVQPELHPEDERRENNGDSGEPHADAQAAGVPEALTSDNLPTEPARHPEDRDPAQLELSDIGLNPPQPWAQPESVAAQPSLAAFDAPKLSGEVSAEGEPGSPTPQTDAELVPPKPFAESSAEAPDPRLTRPGVRVSEIQEEIVAWIKTLFSAAVYAILIVTFGFQVARVEGQSMAPTLEDQDRLIVNKLAYRIGDPRRSDIVMLYYPVDPNKSFVKRVIAEEGDTVRIIDGRVYVNDIPLQDDYVPSEFRSHDDYGPKVVEDGYYFVMGDHRNNSSDSRHWGLVPKKYIIGKVQLRWWPVPTAKMF
jgi:signal peptidase I